MKINFFNLFVVHIYKFERESVLTQDSLPGFEYSLSTGKKVYWDSLPGNLLISKAYERNS